MSASQVNLRPPHRFLHVPLSLALPPRGLAAMILTAVLLLGSAVAIFLACESFVNGIEWLGRRLQVGETATGTILAAFGTALPESVVTLVATAFGTSVAQRQIGIGAALGGPLALSTVAYAAVGLALLAHARRLGRGRTCRVQVDHRRLSRDQAWFLAVFAAKIALGLVVFAVKPWTGCLFLAAYGFYFWRELCGGEELEPPEIEPLKIRPHDPSPGLGWTLLQTLASVAVIFVASRLFVAQLEAARIWLGLRP